MKPDKLAVFLWFLENDGFPSYWIAESFGVSVYWVTFLRKILPRDNPFSQEIQQLKAKSPLRLVTKEEEQAIG